MDRATEGNFVNENPETLHGSGTEEVIEIMDSNENVVDVVPDMQSKYAKNKTENAKSTTYNDKIKEMRVASMLENPETDHGSSSEEIIEIMDSNENVVDVVPDMKSKYVKNKTGNAKSKIQNHKTKEMIVPAVPERKNLKRKAAHPPTSEMVMDSIKVLKKRNGVSFEDIKMYMEEKYEVNMKLLKHHVDKFLQKGVSNGVFEKVDKSGAEGRFKIKKSENIKKDSKKLPGNKGKGKTEKKTAAIKKQVKK